MTGEGEGPTLTLVWSQAARTKRATMPTTRSMWSNVSRGAARMRAVVDDVVAKHTGERVVVVGHGAAIIACLTDVMQLEPGRLRMLPYYTSISTVRALGDRRMVGALGDTAHLE